MIELLGTSFIGSRRWDPSGGFRATERRTGKLLEPAFTPATPSEVEWATVLADTAFQEYRYTSGKLRGEFLRAIAANLEGVADQIVARAMQESALPEARLRGELGRTCGQLRLFAGVCEEGSWVDARIDHGDPKRAPMPKPDMRSMLRPVGPIAVFGASNFPLAYSVAGGDTASAFAAGCPVIVKAHPAHPGTSELAACAIDLAVRETGMPDGVFSMLFDDGFDIGQALVKNRRIQAVGFTGSRKGGLALVELANKRPAPIPVYAEMSSVNPMFMLPEVLSKIPKMLAQGTFASVTMGVGQFCTNPGLVFLTGVDGRDEFVAELATLMRGGTAECMLTQSIEDAYMHGVLSLAKHALVEALVAPEGTGPALFRTTKEDFTKAPSMQQEVFGPATLIVYCDDVAEAEVAAQALDGNLTATLHGTPSDLDANQGLLSLLELKVGRLILNQYPTGLEVGPATVHGGPFPATSDGRTTSVGTRAIVRFARLVCYQNFTNDLLPPELQEANPNGIARVIDGTVEPRRSRQS